MEKIVEELKSVVTFKDSTREGDIVLVVAEEPQMILYGLVTGIDRDVSKKEEWWRVALRLLTIPPQEVVWTLRLPQFTGMEIFTMGGKKRFIKAVDFRPPKSKPDDGDSSGKGKKRSGLRVVK